MLERVVLLVRGRHFDALVIAMFTPATKTIVSQQLFAPERSATDNYELHRAAKRKRIETSRRSKGPTNVFRKQKVMRMIVYASMTRFRVQRQIM